MGFKLIVEGSGTAINLGIDVIRFVHVEIGTPMDSRAKSSDTAATMWVTGNFLSGENNSETLKLFDWSLVPAQSSDAYRKVTVEVICISEIFRKIYLPNAFVVDYNERFNGGTGIGEFTLVLRQKADKIPDVKAEIGGAYESEEQQSN